MKEIYDKRVCEFRIAAIKYTKLEIEQLKPKANENIKNFTGNTKSREMCWIQNGCGCWHTLGSAFKT